MRLWSASDRAFSRSASCCKVTAGSFVVSCVSPHANPPEMARTSRRATPKARCLMLMLLFGEHQAKRLATAKRRFASASSGLLAGVHEVLRVDCLLDRAMQPQRRVVPLLPEVTGLDEAEAVLARDRAAHLRGGREQLGGGGARALQLGWVARVDEERRVQVAVARMAPAAGLQAMAGADLQHGFDRVAEAVEWHDDVLRHLAAALRRYRDRDAVAPAPQRRDLRGARRRMQRERPLAERLVQRGRDRRCLRDRAVGLRYHRERTRRRLERR